MWPICCSIEINEVCTEVVGFATRCASSLWCTRFRFCSKVTCELLSKWTWHCQPSIGIVARLGACCVHIWAAIMWFVCIMYMLCIADKCDIVVHVVAFKSGHGVKVGVPFWRRFRSWACTTPWLYVEPSTLRFWPVYSSCRSCYLNHVLLLEEFRISPKPSSSTCTQSACDTISPRVKSRSLGFSNPGVGVKSHKKIRTPHLWLKASFISAVHRPLWERLNASSVACLWLRFCRDFQHLRLTFNYYFIFVVIRSSLSLVGFLDNVDVICRHIRCVVNLLVSRHCRGHSRLPQLVIIPRFVITLLEPKAHAVNEVVSLYR